MSRGMNNIERQVADLKHETKTHVHELITHRAKLNDQAHEAAKTELGRERKGYSDPEYDALFEAHPAHKDADAMSEEIISLLSRLRHLTVVWRA
jgi:hypothetical protein